VKLYELAHCRAGDKGNVSTLSVFAYDPDDFDRLRRDLTEERVASHLRELAPGGVTRYELPNLAALHFVCTRRGRDRVTVTLNLDAHGKSLSSALLELDLPDSEPDTREGLSTDRSPGSRSSRRV
jgi:hypothetical protein